MITAIKRARALYTDAEIFALTGIPPRTLQDWVQKRRKPPAWARAFITGTMEELCKQRTKQNA